MSGTRANLEHIAVSKVDLGPLVDLELMGGVNCSEMDLSVF